MTPRSCTLAFALLASLACACDECAGAALDDDDAGEGEGEGDAAEGEGEGDAGEGEGEGDAGEGEGEGAEPCTEPAAPTTTLAPALGELTYMQLGLGGIALGEAALLVAPDGAIAVIDVGNTSHDDDVLAALDEVTAALGVPDRAVDVVLLTHFHADHVDGIVGFLENVTVRDGVVFRGLVDVDTVAASPGAFTSLCNALQGQAGLAQPLCAPADDGTAPCDPASWGASTYRRSQCFGLGPLALGDEVTLDIVAASGEIAGRSYETDVGPLLTDDTNGENARSVVAVVERGPFRMLIQGDLTGGGSDTDPMEPFIVAHLDEALATPLPRGVDVLHAGHHGRDTSTSLTWAERLLPSDGRSRNVVMGISTAHLGSPHAAVLDVILDRLGDAGRAWTTRVAAGGATDPLLVDAGGGRVVVVTVDGGRGYLVQAQDDAGNALETRAFASVGCAP